MGYSHRSAACSINTFLPLLLLLVVTVTTVTRSAWVEDYASNHGCGETTVVAELCDPDEAAANHACSDACHYNGCGGGRCVYLGAGGIGMALGCHCLR